MRDIRDRDSVSLDHRQCCSLQVVRSCRDVRVTHVQCGTARKLVYIRPNHCFVQTTWLPRRRGGPGSHGWDSLPQPRLVATTSLQLTISRTRVRGVGAAGPEEPCMRMRTQVQLPWQCTHASAAQCHGALSDRSYLSPLALSHAAGHLPPSMPAGG